MSRGLGKLQRTILALLDSNDELDTFTLTALAYDCQPDAAGRVLVTDAQLVATRRALASLAKAGKVFAVGRRYRLNREHWMNERNGLAYTLRKMQTLNGLDQGRGRVGECEARIKLMVPLIERAVALGIDWAPR